MLAGTFRNSLSVFIQSLSAPHATGKLAIALLPFRQVARLAASPIYRPQPSRQIRPDWSSAFAGRPSAQPRAVARYVLSARSMLRRRGISSVLYYAVAQNDEIGLQAHVWVRAGELDVIGGERPGRFAALAIFGP